MEKIPGIRISQLMDGELDQAEGVLEIRRLEQDEALIQEWATYHLIRDVLRGEAGIGAGLAERVCERLQDEPAILSPRFKLPAQPSRYALPIAAAVAGVALVAWLAFFSGTHQGGTPLEQRFTLSPTTPPDKDAMSRYLVAHREFSPMTAMQGGGSYVRTVWNEDPDPAR